MVLTKFDNLVREEHLEELLKSPDITNQQNDLNSRF